MSSHSSLPNNHIRSTNTIGANAHKNSYRLKPIAATIAGIALIMSNASYAADPTVADLQAQIEQLKQVIAAQKAELDKQGKAAPQAPAAAAQAPATPTQDDSKTLG